eukprot:1158266-Pelagomonas_calceolata.AAC.3
MSGNMSNAPWLQAPLVPQQVLDLEHACMLLAECTGHGRGLCYHAITPLVLSDAAAGYNCALHRGSITVQFGLKIHQLRQPISYAWQRGS